MSEPPRTALIESASDVNIRIVAEQIKETNALLQRVLDHLQGQARGVSGDPEYVVLGRTATNLRSYNFRSNRKPEESEDDWLKRTRRLQEEFDKDKDMGTDPMDVSRYIANRKKWGNAKKDAGGYDEPDSITFDNGGAYRKRRE